MVDPGRATDAEARRARAERILDAATALLLRLGYKRVTIDDVAEKAGVGKGTIYLHWKTREALFLAVLERESVEVTEGLVAALREDPTAVLLHRLTREFFLRIMERPLLHAALVGDLELLGRMAKAADRQALNARHAQAFAEYLQLLQGRGLVRPDFDPHGLVFAYDATITGFFLQEEPASEERRLPLEHQADLIETVVRRAFEPEAPPAREAVLAVAPRCIEVFDEITAGLRGHLAEAY